MPEFFGQNDNYTIPAIIFIRRIDDLARTNNWNDTTTYANVANALRGFACDWIFTILDQVLARLHKNHLKINQEKFVFGNTHPGEANWGRTSSKRSRMPSCPPTSRLLGTLWDYAIPSRPISKILQSLQHHYSGSQVRIWATNQALY